MIQPEAICGFLWERDVDLVLVMDALSGGPLTSAIYLAVGASVGELRVERNAWRTGGRETDVLITGAGGTLLIEDKINAPFQPLQPESYRDEVVRLRAEGKPAWAVLVCPAARKAAYVEAAAGCFDRVVTLEQLAAVARTSGDRLGRAIALVLEGAARPRPSHGVADDDRIAWGEEYRALFRDRVEPGKFMVGPGCFRTVNSVSGWFTDVSFKGLYGFGHMVLDGVVLVDLQKAFHSKPMDLPEQAGLTDSKALWTLRIPLQRMSFDVPPQDQVEAIDEAVDAATALRPWLVKYAETCASTRVVPAPSG